MPPMQQGSLAKQIARWTALAALFLVTLTPLVVIDGFFFPFITGKAFLFRILVEVAVAAWVVLAFLDKEYRPRFSWLGVAVFAFVAWMFIADLFAMNVSKAFWSNFERMEGWVLLIHLVGFFYAASAVLRVEKKWRTWFLASLGVAAIVSAHGILQQLGAMPIHQGSTRIDSSFGNSAYFAIYLLFNAFIALWLAFTEKRPWLTYTLVAFAALEALLIFLTETRGTVLGLLAGLIFVGGAFAFTGSKRARRYGAWGAAVVILLAGGLYVARDTAFVVGNDVLHRITSINLADGQTRFTIWHMAEEGVTQGPKQLVLGWGQEGFNYIFNQYYEPSLYAQEPWFDRAHNAFIDWLVAGGIPAFVLYLALFGSVTWLLWTKTELGKSERILLTAALIGYAVHNLFVFDNLYAYVYFFAFLAMVDSQVARPCEKFDAAPEVSDADGLAYVLPIAAALLLATIWFVNVRSMNTSSELITAISPSDPATQLAAFESLTKQSGYPGMQEVREQLVSFAANLAATQGTANASTTAAAVLLAVSEMGKQVAAYPEDARERLELASAYRAAGDSKDALAQVSAALALSPKKEAIWIEAGATEWDLHDFAAARTDFDTAYALGPEFTALASYAAAGEYAAGDAKAGDATLMKAFGTTTVDSDILAAGYFYGQDWSRLIALARLRATAPGVSAQDLFNAASAFYAAHDGADAIATLQKAAVLEPAAAQEVQAAIAQIRAGK